MSVLEIVLDQEIGVLQLGNISDPHCMIGSLHDTL